MEKLPNAANTDREELDDTADQLQDAMDEKLRQLQDKEHRSVFVQVCLVLSNLQVKNFGHSIRLFIMSMGQKNQNLILDLLLWALVLVVSRSPKKVQKELLLQVKKLQLR